MNDKIIKRSSLDSREGLLDELVAIETEGWGSARGEHFLNYVRSHIVRPQVFASGLRGLGADQAEATGWEVAWEVLNGSSIRDAKSPWGLLWVAVRRAIQGELMASMYLTQERESWRVRRTQMWIDQNPRFDPPFSLTRLVEKGWERAEEPEVRVPIGRRLQIVINALAQVGWEQRTAYAVVEGIALTAARNGTKTAEAQGWRPLATHLGVPPWQVRRVMVVLLGAPGWPGVMERMVTEGPQVLEQEDMRAALRSTIVSSWPTPVLAARRARTGNLEDSIPVAS